MPAIAHWSAKSQALEKIAHTIVITPDGAGPWPVVYLLHGMFDDHTAWLHKATILEHAQRLGLMLVLPDGGLGFYRDVPGTARRYESHILELVGQVDATFRTIPGKRGIGGLSMGGYGALRLGLNHPDLFTSVTAHSSVADVARWVREKPNLPLADAFPGGRVPPRDDLLKLIRRAGPKPRLALDCGTEDFLIEHNRTLHAAMTRAKVPHLYLEYPGAHSWEYWNARIGDALDFHAGCFQAGRRRPRA